MKPATIILALIIALPLAVAVPMLLPFSGRLVQNGQAMTGTHSIDLELYDNYTDGSRLWYENLTPTLTSSGVYDLIGGYQSGISPSWFSSPLFLQIHIDGAVSSYRMNLTSVPYALFADTAQNVPYISNSSGWYNDSVSTSTDLQVMMTNTINFTNTHAFDFVFENSSGWTDLQPEASITRGTVSGDILNIRGDYVWVGLSQPFDSVYFDIGTAKSAGGSMEFQYSQGGDTWANLPVTDGTTNLTVDGAITFTPPGDWAVDSVWTSTPVYWVRIGTTGAAYTTEPTAYLIVPKRAENTFLFSANKYDNSNSGIVADANGLVTLKNVNTITALGSITGVGIAAGGAISGATTIAASGIVTLTGAAVGFTSADGLILQDTTAATLNAGRQWSRRLRFSARVWNGTSTTTSWIIENQVVNVTAPNPEPGNALVTSSSHNGVYVEQLRLWDNGTMILSPNNGGGLAVGMSNLPFNYSLALPNNSSRAALAYGWYTYSDDQLKTEQKELTKGVETIMQLQPKEYLQHDTAQYTSYVCSGKEFVNVDECGNESFTEKENYVIDKNGKQNIGLVAQEVKDVVPEAVMGGGILAIDYDRLVPILIKAVQQQQQQIVDQQKRIDEFEQRIQKLEGK